MAGGIRRARRLIVLLAVVFTLTVIGMRTAMLWNEREAALARAEDQMREVARLVDEYARRTFDTSDLVAELAIEGIRRRGGIEALRGSEAAQRWLHDLAQRTAGDYLMAVDGDGVPVALSSQHPAPGVSLADRSWFRAHRDVGQERHVGRALHSRITDEVLFTYTRAIRLPEDPRVLEGVVQVAMRLGFFQDAMGAGPADALEATLGLWSHAGEVVARTGLTPAQIETLTAPEMVRQMIRTRPRGALRAEVFGRDRLIAWRWVEGWPVVATASVPVAQVLAPWRRDVAWSVLLSLAVLAVAFVLGWTAQRLVRHEEATLAALATANGALQEAREELEARVRERTGALAEANRQLGEKEARFRAIFASQFQLTALLAPDGTVLEANQAALGFAGAGADAVVGRRLPDAAGWESAGPEARRRLEDAIAAASAGAFVRFDTELRAADDGRLATIDVSLKPVRDAGGNIAGLLAEGRDVTALKAAQAQLHEAQKLDVLGQLTGGIAHDFNNLLMAVLGNLALLRKRLAPGDERMQRLLEGAVQGAQRGAALTQRLLAFARRQALRPEAIDVAALVDGMSDLIARSLGPGIRVVVEVPPGTPPILADHTQMEMALLNLAVNARDGMPGGGTLTIAAREEPVPEGDRAAPSPEGDRPADLPPGRRFVRLVVADTGIGMDAATLARATEPFFTTKGVGKGSGLGLSMVHGLAAQSGGKLRLRSRPGEGTTVELWLPVATDRPAPAAAPAPEEEAEALACPGGEEPLTILLVDDDPLVRAGTAAMLEDLGHRVRTAASGQEALAALGDAEAMPVALMVTDFAMPGMNGLELVERARERHPGLPIVMATGYAELPAARIRREVTEPGWAGPGSGRGAAAAEAPSAEGFHARLRQATAGARPPIRYLAKPYRQEELAASIARARRDAGRLAPTPGAVPPAAAGEEKASSPATDGDEKASPPVAAGEETASTRAALAGQALRPAR